jgi:hypothetical protein
MSTLTVTAKGQITLRRAAQPTGKISDVFDFLKRKNGPTLSIEEMNRIAARGWAGKR